MPVRTTVPKLEPHILGGVQPRGCTVLTWSLEMAKPTEQEIAARAYRLWEAAGMPKDRDDEFWHAAEQELLNEDKSNPMQTPHSPDR
jgi:hypothetical protein